MSVYDANEIVETVLKIPTENRATVVLIDEVQFLETALTAVIRLLAEGIDVYVAGLSSDMNQQGWPAVMALIPRATHIHMLKACCSKCSSMTATFSSRVVPLEKHNKTNVSLGGTGVYEARCSRCFTKPEEDVDL